MSSFYERNNRPASDRSGGAVRAPHPSTPRPATALNCLIENAVVHAGDRARIVVRAYRDGDGAVIEVEDDGPGVAPDRLVDVLDRRSAGRRGTARAWASRS
jgi:anti-sigma regulatory factor (Ser/Thr protein kinase)